MARLSRARIGVSSTVVVRDKVLQGHRLRTRDVPADAYGGTYATADGTAVAVYMSSYYEPDDQVLQSVADLFDTFYHGDELSSVTIYLAPEDEIHALCQSSDADSCFEDESDTIDLVGTPPSDGTPVEEIAAHEYGHAIAWARVNPFDRTATAVQWGPEYWASYEGVCPRVNRGTAFPGDEGSHYTQNPGEAWADTNRILNGGQPSLWQFDQSFYPNATDLKLAKEDILKPWSGNTRSRVAGAFHHGRPGTARDKLTTFDDGPRASVTLTTHGALRASLYMYWSTGRLAAQLTGQQHTKTIRFSICGEPYVSFRIQRHSGYGTYSLVANAP